MVRNLAPHPSRPYEAVINRRLRYGFGCYMQPWLGCYRIWVHTPALHRRGGQGHRRGHADPPRPDPGMEPDDGSPLSPAWSRRAGDEGKGGRGAKAGENGQEAGQGFDRPVGARRGIIAALRTRLLRPAACEGQNDEQEGPGRGDQESGAGEVIPEWGAFLLLFYGSSAPGGDP